MLVGWRSFYGEHLLTGATVEAHFERIGARPAIVRARELDDLRPDLQRHHPELRAGKPSDIPTAGDGPAACGRYGESDTRYAGLSRAGAPPDTGARQPMAGLVIYEILSAIALVVSAWVLFGKAGQRGWAAIVPIYGHVVLLRVVDRPRWWISRCSRPRWCSERPPPTVVTFTLVSFVLTVIVAIDLAKSFGRGALLGVGVALLPLVFAPILAFGASEYRGPRGSYGPPSSSEPTPAW